MEFDWVEEKGLAIFFFAFNKIKGKRGKNMK